jgi:hypothetical protein
MSAVMLFFGAARLELSERDMERVLARMRAMGALGAEVLLDPPPAI